MLLLKISITLKKEDESFKNLKIINNQLSSFSNSVNSVIQFFTTKGNFLGQ